MSSLLPYSGVSDLQIIAAAGHGDQQAFAELVRRYSQVIMATVQFYLPAKTALCNSADDATQESWLTILQKLTSYDSTRGSFRSWACGIASRVAWRFRFRQYQTNQREQLMTNFDEVPQPENQGFNDEGNVSLVEVTDILGPRRKRFLEAFIRSNGNKRHIAQELGCSLRTVQARVKDLRQFVLVRLHLRK